MMEAASADRSMPEDSLLRPTLLGILRLGWVHQMSLADTEVPWHGKRIDLGFLRATSGDPVAIELKVSSTGRAIEQATLNRYLTPASWVATWTPPSREMRGRAAARGVGMLLVADRGLYPLLYPASGELHTPALTDHLEQRGRRVRDLLSGLRA